MVSGVKEASRGTTRGRFIADSNTVTTGELGASSGDWSPVDSEVFESVKVDTMMVASPKGHF
jgi:hypothetical protein